jgi:hypothetical protein
VRHPKQIGSGQGWLRDHPTRISSATKYGMDRSGHMATNQIGGAAWSPSRIGGGQGWLYDLLNQIVVPA